MPNETSVALIARSADVAPMLGVDRSGGIGMLEFLIALLIFSMGMMGLLSAQLAGKQAGFGASQRSVATSLARDILERMRANSGQIQAYQVSDAGDASRRLPLPDTDCETAACSAVQLAAFDLWQWESLLLGETEKYSEGYAGGLVSPRACINAEGGTVVVAISWGSATEAAYAPGAVCGGDEVLDNATPGGDMKQRHQIAISTFIGAHG
jgi:type IV pilus assembly protein PilV